MQAQYPIGGVSGFPCLQPDLRWCSGVPFFVMGAYGALRIGPDAVNLAGARRAAFRIAKTLKGLLEDENCQSGAC